MIGVFEEILEDSLAPWCYMVPLPGDLFQWNSLKLEFYIWKLAHAQKLLKDQLKKNFLE